jgi:maleylpyruvate isomerase
MIFYDYWRSSSAWRVRIALHWKGIAFERRPVNLLAGEQHGEAFRAINPMGQVPTLLVDDGGPSGIIAQSQAILAFLEERFPTPALLPDSSWERARARQIAEMITSGIQPYQNLAFTDHLAASGFGHSRGITRHFVRGGMAAVERTAIETAGTFLVGGAPSVADVCLVPQLYAARRFDVDLTSFPTLLRVEAACAALPAFKAAHPDAQSDAPSTTR